MTLRSGLPLALYHTILFTSVFAEVKCNRPIVLQASNCSHMFRAAFNASGQKPVVPDLAAVLKSGLALDLAFYTFGRLVPSLNGRMGDKFGVL